MLAFTPEVEAALSWFRATHELTTVNGRVSWERRWLPGPGSLSEQDARLMDALDLLQQVHNDLVQQTRKDRDRDSDG